MKPSNPKDALGVRRIPYNLLPWPVLGELALAFLEGALKYGASNWRRIGVRSSVYTAAAMRHIAQYEEGEDIDQDSGEHHLVKAMACLAIIRDAQRRNLCVDDRKPATDAGWVQELNARTAALVDRFPNPPEPFLESPPDRATSASEPHDIPKPSDE